MGNGTICWWEAPDAKLPSSEIDRLNRQRVAALLQETQEIETRQFSWYELSLWNSALYTNRQLVGFRWGFEDNDQAELWPTNLRTENIIENVGQTMLAKAASSPLRPTLVPHGASWKTARNVKLADKFVFGMWRQTMAEEKSLAMFNDAYTAGLGTLQVEFDAERNAVSVESVFFDNVVIDNRECPSRGMPKTYRIRKPMHRSAVESKFKKQLAGKQLGKAEKGYMPKRRRGKDFEIVIEVWRLPDDDGTNGRHMVVCCDQVMVDEPWTEQWVPLVFMHWQDRQSGFFTKGGVEQVIPYQVKQNELNDAIDKSQKIGCHPALLAPASTTFDWSQWDSENVGGILLYHGMAPTDLKISTNLAELYAERERNKAAAYSHMGLSEMFAMGDVPQQVRMDSSAGIREARNMEDARHLRLWRAYEIARLDLARTMMRVVARAKPSSFTTLYKPYAATSKGRTVAYEAIKDLNEDAYTWEMAAASLSQQTPAARRETLRDWASRQQTGSGATSQMVTNPDLEMIERMEIASEEDVERHMELMEEGKYEAPNEFTNLSKGIMMVTENLHRLRRYEDLKRTDDVIQFHEKWIVTAGSRIAAAAQKQMQMQQPNPMPAYAPTQGMAGTSAATAQ